MSEEKKAVPEAVSTDKATIKMLHIAQERGQETIFDRAVKMKPCNIGAEGICCKICSQGPCRLPLTKAIKYGTEPDNRKGLCGATAETTSARNLLRTMAGGSAAHPAHGRAAPETSRAHALSPPRSTPHQSPIKLREVRGH